MYNSVLGRTILGHYYLINKSDRIGCKTWHLKYTVNKI